MGPGGSLWNLLTCYRLRLGDEKLKVFMSFVHSCVELNRDNETNEPYDIMNDTREIQNLTIVEKTYKLSIEPTSLRLNKYYYKIYYVFLNTLFASVLPLLLLLILNIKTAHELFKMGQQSDHSPTFNVGRKITIEASNQSKPKSSSPCPTVLTNTNGEDPQISRDTRAASIVTTIANSPKNSETDILVVAGLDYGT